MADSDRPHIALLAFPFGTHAPPLLSFGIALAAAAPYANISFLGTRQCCAAMVESSDPPENMKVVYVSDGVPEGYVFKGTPQEHPGLFMDAAPSIFRLGLEQAAAAWGRRPSCLVLDSFLYFGEELAQESNIPWLSFWTSGIHALSCILHSSAIIHRFEAAEREKLGDERLDFIPGMWCAKVEDLPDGIVFGNKHMPFSIIFQKMGPALAKATAVIINSFEEMEPAITADMKSKLRMFLSIGPLQNPRFHHHRQEEEDCILWLDGQKARSVAYVSFGTVAALPEEEMVAMAEALEEGRAAFLWSMRGEVKARLPQGFVERSKGRGMVVGWAPQKRVLGHRSVGAFVTHCGWSSVVESVGGGVPMICRPVFGDQRLNRCMVEDVIGGGVGVEGGAITKEGMERRLRMVLGTQKGEEMRDRMREMMVMADMAVRPVGGTSSLNFRALVTLVTSTTTPVGTTAAAPT